MKRFLCLLLALVMLIGMMPVTASAANECNVSDNVIDITDKVVYEKKYVGAAKAVNIGITGADVESATEDDTTIEIVLDGNTASDATFGVEFGTALDKNMNMSGHTATVTLSGGTASVDMTLKVQYLSMASWSGTVTYTLNFSLGEVSTTPPTRIVEADSKSTYAGVAVDIDLKGYFDGATQYYLDNTPLDRRTYTFSSFVGGTHTLLFYASNGNGDCPDPVTVTVEVTEITSGAWLGITTSNGSVNFVKFTDADGGEIDGLKVSLDNTVITVTLPRSIAFDEKITATFDLTQKDGYPKLSTTNRFNGTNDTKAYTTTLSGGTGSATMYLYNTAPKAVSNNYTTYKIEYAIENEIPTLAEGHSTQGSANKSAGEAYTLDLSTVFTDPDGDTLTYSVKINGEDAVAADTNYSFNATIGGTYTLEFFANDGMATSQDSYTVTLDVKNSDVTYDMTVLLPDDITPTFYITNGYDENKIDIIGETLTFVGGEASEGLVPYTVYVPENISEISVRDTEYGGMAIPASPEGTATLCKVETKIVDLGDREITGTVSVSYSTYKVCGNGKFLLVQGNEYTFTATPTDSSSYNTASATLVPEDTVIIEVTYKNPKTVTTSTGATAKLFKYANNYWVHTVYEPLATVDNGDGTSTHYFTASGDLSYRVSMEGKITKAGYLTRNSVTVLHTEDDALPSDRINYALAGTDASAVADDSLLLNINQQNHLCLSVGETKTVKAYRAWELINNYMNHIIEPDFNFNIISGEDVVSLTPYENQPMTNGSGNWCTLTAISEGTAIIEVTYDAMAIEGGSYSGFYGATDTARTGLFVVTVGTAPKVDFGIESKTSAGSVTYSEANAKPWDSELDTLYFFGDSGEIKLSPTLENGTVTEVAVSGHKGNTYTVLEGTDGVYVSPIVSGNNIIRVTTDKGVAYQIVRGDKLELVVKNVTNPGRAVSAGDTVSIKLVGVHTPIPKISGTYNPGYSGNTDGNSNAHLHYSFGDSDIKSEGKQYDFSLYGTTLEFTLPSNDETEFTLTDGYIGVGVIGVTGFSDDGDSHRNIPDSGGLTRGSASTFTTRSILPDITVKLGMLPSDNVAPFIRETAPQSASLNLGGTYAISMSRIFTDIDGDTMTYTAKVGEGEASAIDEYYTFTPDATGTYTIVFTANDGSVDSDEHTLTLTVKEREISSTPSVDYEVDGEIKGYVSISFTDNGKRVEGEQNVKYPKALGTIISTKRVPFAEGDTVADVTLRLLDAQGFTYEHTGTTKNGFYLASIGDFTLKGITYDSFGEFDAGSGSGWMITLNKDFIKYGASEFKVENGDVIKWQYTCQLGADIGDPFYSNVPTVINPEKETDETITFPDVQKDDWHYEAVKYVFENKLMQGTGKNFEPDSFMTRAMFVTVLYRMASPEKTDYDHKFTDVPSDEWYSDAVAWAAENDIAGGVNESEFAPHEYITREQMALIIYRYVTMIGIDVSISVKLDDFTDKNDVSEWALDAVIWANSAGIINGTGENTLSPKDNTTRAQVATILMRFCEMN